ncbi:MAG: hypothetical protein A2X94_16010 [Bdellovibrionales bacterium GWB1_55_8]|nr:MAG: hypothetical protein A2X94_16010 [Bdellovibrionales bacterium GWB1_55_8]
MSESATSLQQLALNPEDALFTNQIQGLAVVLHRNERPLHGLAGLLDWRFHGAVSAFMRAGAISGDPGQCAYVPITRNGTVYHLLFLGAGDCTAPGKRAAATAETFAVIRKNLGSLGLQRIAISRADFGGMDDDHLRNNLKGLPLWIVH